jgi:hypothetical protein
MRSVEQNRAWLRAVVDGRTGQDAAGVVGIVVGNVLELRDNVVPYTLLIVLRSALVLVRHCGRCHRDLLESISCNKGANRV